MKRLIFWSVLVSGAVVINGCNGKLGAGLILKEDTAVVTQGESKEIDVIANDTFDPNANQHGTHVVLKEIVVVPQKGTVVVNSGNNTVTYSANSGATGDDYFTYSAYATGQKELYSGGTTEFNTTANEANVTVHITEVQNLKPIANSFTVELNCSVAGEPSVEITLTGNDPEGEDVLYAIVSDSYPFFGTVSTVTNGNHVTYTPNNSSLCDNDQNDMIQYHVFDGLQYSEEANVTVHPVH